MKNLGGLMERFKHLKAPKRTVRNAITQAVGEILGNEIEALCKEHPEWIKISDEATVYIQAPSAIKNIIFEQKLDILSRANSILGKEQLKHMR